MAAAEMREDILNNNRHASLRLVVAGIGGGDAAAGANAILQLVAEGHV
jgi:hypothetical protein